MTTRVVFKPTPVDQEGVSIRWNLPNINKKLSKTLLRYGFAKTELRVELMAVGYEANDIEVRLNVPFRVENKGKSFASTVMVSGQGRNIDAAAKEAIDAVCDGIVRHVKFSASGLL
ncbi:MAG: hypothetical protein QM744_02845 [Mesorhizobium sp.]